MIPNPTPLRQALLDSAIVGLAILLPCIATLTAGVLLSWGMGDQPLLWCTSGLALLCTVLATSVGSGLILDLACASGSTGEQTATGDTGESRSEPTPIISETGEI